MAKESFEDPEIAKIINENFIPIKVDRDERPDIDKRYQDFVVLTTGNGGWPLTVFLTPSGQPFYGGTYFPPHDRWGIMGFRSLLTVILTLWRQKREDIKESTKEILKQLENLSKSQKPGKITSNLLETGISATLESIDYVNGGFLGIPKFHHASALELLMYHYVLTDDVEIKKRVRNALEVSLERMAYGGIYDHLLGGFFRYSVDEEWIFPHFEKMLPDNAELLKIYTLAYQIFKKDLYRDVAFGIVNYYKRFGSSRKGGFYASQAADIGEIEQGNYYTFSLDDLKACLSLEEVELAKTYFGFETKGRMPTNPKKNVLHVAIKEEDLAKELRIDERNLKERIRLLKAKMLTYREKYRKIPPFDKTIYTGWNALMVDALCEFYKVFKDPWAVQSAKKTVQRILDENRESERIFHSPRVFGFSEDYLFFAMALLSLFEVTGRKRYLEYAINVTKEALKRFWDNEDFGFFDSEENLGTGLLSIKRKDIQDQPNRSANGIAPYLFGLLYALTGDYFFYEMAEKSLEAFSEVISKNPILSHSYLLGLYSHKEGILKIETENFFDKSLGFFWPFKFVVRKRIPGITVCKQSTCQSFQNWESLLENLKNIRGEKQ